MNSRVTSTDWRIDGDVNRIHKLFCRWFWPLPFNGNASNWWRLMLNSCRIRKCIQFCFVLSSLHTNRRNMGLCRHREFGHHLHADHMIFCETRVSFTGVGCIWPGLKHPGCGLPVHEVITTNSAAVNLANDGDILGFGIFWFYSRFHTTSIVWILGSTREISTPWYLHVVSFSTYYLAVGAGC